MSEMLWELLEWHQLFNKVNNGEPLIVLDLRSRDSYDNCRLRKSHHVLALDSLSAVLDEALKTRTDVINSEIRGTRNFVLLFPRDSSSELHAEYYSKLDSYITGRNGCIVVGVENLEDQQTMSFAAHLYFVQCIEDFFEHYKPCTFLLESGARKRCYSSNDFKYYASEILPDFLFLGDFCNATDEHQLRAHGITHVIDATNVFQSKPVCEKLGLQYLPIEIWDVETEDIRKHFAVSNAFICAAKDSGPLARVLVHCRAGWSRSPTLVLAYMLAHCGLSLVEAAQRVVRERPMVCPNEGFRAQLVAFELEVFAGPGEHRCSGAAELREKILQVSCLWSQPSAAETDFDRIPIEAFKRRTPQQMLEEEAAPKESAPAVAKPKKAFLKRGEGKKIQPLGGRARRLVIELPQQEPQQEQPPCDELLFLVTVSSESDQMPPGDTQQT
eukprot:gene28740-34693_t